MFMCVDIYGSKKYNKYFPILLLLSGRLHTIEALFL